MANRTPKGYCAVGDVEAWLGADFSGMQQALCATLIARAEAEIDRVTNRGWLLGTVTSERHDCPPRALYVRYPPILAVTGITYRTALGGTETALVAASDYELVDAGAGLIRLTDPSAYERVLVSYTQPTTAPAEVEQICIELVAAWLQPSLLPESYGLTQVMTPQLTTMFGRGVTVGQIPEQLRERLDELRFVAAG